MIHMGVITQVQYKTYNCKVQTKEIQIKSAKWTRIQGVYGQTLCKLEVHGQACAHACYIYHLQLYRGNGETEPNHVIIIEVTYCNTFIMGWCTHDNWTRVQTLHPPHHATRGTGSKKFNTGRLIPLVHTP